MANSIFVPKNRQRTTKKISVVVDAELHQSIEEIQAALSEHSPNLMFDTNEICSAALKTAVNKARRELKG